VENPRSAPVFPLPLSANSLVRRNRARFRRRVLPETVFVMVRSSPQASDWLATRPKVFRIFV